MAWWKPRDRAGSSVEEGAPTDPGYQPGNPHGIDLTDFEQRSFSPGLPIPMPSVWSGYPQSWSAPAWGGAGSGGGFAGGGLSRLIDIAWACIDLNANVLSSFPVYRQKNGEILSSPSWMVNPDDTIYSGWPEFAKQLFWDFQLGEAFVLGMGFGADNKPTRLRIIPPWLVDSELKGGKRVYHIGALDITDEVLHIRNISNVTDARGHCPLEAAGARMVTAGLLERYAANLAETGGKPHYWLDVPSRTLNGPESADLLDQWVASRARHAGGPGVLSGGIGLKETTAMSARDMTLIEIAQFTEARIAILTGVPPFLVALPMASGESVPYANVSQLFSFHDRASLRPKAAHVMSALSNWALPRGQSVELNRDDYSRPDYYERAQANVLYVNAKVLGTDEVRTMERFSGPAPAAALTGAETSGGDGNAGPTTGVASPAPAVS